MGTLEDHHLHGWPAPRRDRRPMGAGRTDEWRSLPGLCREGAGPALVGWRHRRDRQPAGPQGGGCLRAAIEASGAKLLYLPPYSPDLNPIEMAFAKLKTLLRTAAERTREDLWNRIGGPLDM